MDDAAVAVAECEESPAAEEQSPPLTMSDRLHIADSKEVYSPAIGLGALERSVLATFGIASEVPRALNELLDGLMGPDSASDDTMEASTASAAAAPAIFGTPMTSTCPCP